MGIPATVELAPEGVEVHEGVEGRNKEKSPIEGKRPFAPKLHETLAACAKKTVPSTLSSARRLSAVQPHQLLAAGARIRQAEVLNERDEPAFGGRGARRADGLGPGIDGRDAEQSPFGSGNRRGGIDVPRQLPLSVWEMVDLEDAVKRGGTKRSAVCHEATEDGSTQLRPPQYLGYLAERWRRTVAETRRMSETTIYVISLRNQSASSVSSVSSLCESGGTGRRAGLRIR